MANTLLDARNAVRQGLPAEITLEEGLRRTVRWYLDNADWWQPLLDRADVGQRLGVGA